MKSHLNDKNIEKLAKVKSELEKSESHYVGMGEEMPMELVGFSAFVGDEGNHFDDLGITGGSGSSTMADKPKVSTGKQVLDAVGGVGGAVDLLSGLLGGRGGRGGDSTPPPVEEKKPDNTMLYVGIGAGVLLLIVIIIVVMKNK